MSLSGCRNLKCREESVVAQQEVAGKRIVAGWSGGDQFLVSGPRCGMVKGSQAVVEVIAAASRRVSPGHVVASCNLPVVVHRQYRVYLRSLRRGAHRSRETERRALIKRIGHQDFGRGTPWL